MRCVPGLGLRSQQQSRVSGATFRICHILCTVNNNFVNTENKQLLDETKPPTQLDEHEVNTNVTEIGFIHGVLNKQA